MSMCKVDVESPSVPLTRSFKRRKLFFTWMFFHVFDCFFVFLFVFCFCLDQDTVPKRLRFTFQPKRNVEGRRRRWTGLRDLCDGPCLRTVHPKHPVAPRENGDLYHPTRPLLLHIQESQKRKNSFFYWVERTTNLGCIKVKFPNKIYTLLTCMWVIC